MSNSAALNIFVHIPKTAGERIKKNIKASLPKNAFIHSSYNYLVQYYDIKHKKNKFYHGKEDFESYLASLTEREKAKIRCIGGHDSYFGIHKFFASKPKYMIFFREPVSRTLSLYNYEKWVCHSYATFNGILNIRQKNALERINNHFLIKDREPSFEEWLMESYDKKHPFYFTMGRHLQHLGFLNPNVSENSIQEALQKFHFIGITEQYDEDALFLYHEIGINKFGSDPHASKPFIRISDLDASIIEKVKKFNKIDFVLYQNALDINKKFKQSNSYFYLSVKRKQRKQSRFNFRKKCSDHFLSFLNFFWIPLKKQLKNCSLCRYLNNKIKYSYPQPD